MTSMPFAQAGVRLTLELSGTNRQLDAATGIRHDF